MDKFGSVRFRGVFFWTMNWTTSSVLPIFQNLELNSWFWFIRVRFWFSNIENLNRTPFVFNSPKNLKKHVCRSKLSLILLFQTRNQGIYMLCCLMNCRNVSISIRTLKNLKSFKCFSRKAVAACCTRDTTTTKCPLRGSGWSLDGKIITRQAL